MQKEPSSKTNSSFISNDIAEEEFWAEALKEKSEMKEKNQESFVPAENEGEPGWLEENYDGQLAVDVYQTEKEIVIKSTIAGVKAEDIDISINNDMITIKGSRRLKEEVSKENYFYQECYWGGFSRSIILPVEVKSDKTEALMENGILTIILPKANKTKAAVIKVKEKK